MNPLLERGVAKALVILYHREHGVTGSDPTVSNANVQAIQDLFAEYGDHLEPYTIEAILEDFQSRDYVMLGPKAASEDGGRQVTKIYPMRLKRQYNLWEVEEE